MMMMMTMMRAEQRPLTVSRQVVVNYTSNRAEPSRARYDFGSTVHCF